MLAANLRIRGKKQDYYNEKFNLQRRKLSGYW